MNTCIVITTSFNVGPTGEIVKKICDGFLENGFQPAIISYKYKDSGKAYNRFIIPRFSLLKNLSLEKMRLILFKSFNDLCYYFYDYYTVSKWLKYHKKSNPCFIFVVCSGNISIRLLRLGLQLAKEYNIPYIIHGTDPLPSPIEWGEKTIYRKSVLSAIKPYFKKADMVCASNPQMLSYQLYELNLLNKKSFVLYNPVDTWKPLGDKKVKKSSFLYLGSVYGKRDVGFLLDGFMKLIDILSEIELVFVGSGIDLRKFDIPEEKVKNFKVIAWTDKVDEYIEEAEVLLDYNANITGDVFLSSKFINYLGYDRKILLVSAENSAPQDFTKRFQNNGLICTSFEKEDFLLKALYSTDVSIQDWTLRKKLCEQLNSKKQISDLLTKLFV